MRTEPALADGQPVWSPDRRLLAHRSAIRSGVKPTIKVLRTGSREIHSVWQAQDTRVLGDIGWSADGSTLAIGSAFEDQFTLQLWAVDSQEAGYRWTRQRYHDLATDLPSHAPRLVSWSSDGMHVAFVAKGEKGDNGAVMWLDHLYVVDVVRGSTVLKWKVGGFHHRAAVRSLTWSPDGRICVTGSADGLVEAVEVDSGRALISTALHGVGVNAMTWSPDGRRLASAARDGSVKVVALEGGRELLNFHLSEDGGTHVIWSPDGTRLAAANETGTIQVWDASRGYEFSEQRKRQGELAWAYYRRALKQSTTIRHADLREALRLAPSELGFRRLRGSAQAILGDFDKAAQEYANAMKAGPRLSFPSAQRHGWALLGAGRIDAYQRYCASLVDEFVDTQVLSNGGFVAWLCVLTAHETINTGNVLALARGWETEERYDPATLCLGAALFRDGQSEEAVQVLTDLASRLAQSGNPDSKHSLACSQYFLAMARHHLGDRLQSRTNLEDATESAEEVLRSGTWFQKVELAALDRETRALIGARGSSD